MPARNWLAPQWHHSRVVLWGSGEYTEAGAAIDMELLELYGISSVAAIPTAAGLEADARRWLSAATVHYERLGVSVVEVPAFTAADTDNPELARLVDNVDCIFFSGGRPDYLLGALSGSELWRHVEAAVERGTVLCASSAGAMVLGSHLLRNPLAAFSGEDGAAWVPALGALDAVVLPHFDRVLTRGSAYGLMDAAPPQIRRSWIGIDEDTAVLFDGSKGGAVSVLGSGSATIVVEGRSAVHRAGSLTGSGNWADEAI